MRLAVASAAAILAVSCAVAQAAPDGNALFAANCAACHQADASGMAGQFPALKNRVGKIAATPEGKAYLADVLTHGLSGSIDAAGDSISGFMPSFARLSDEQIAAILSAVAAMGDTKPAPSFTVAEIAAARARSLTPAAVNAERATLDGKHKLP
ncbi:cytochrome c [Acetobacteraceae bacterium KSS8]|uniref:Cytochrome c n=1 Tax=Endosaccharibacter trunci TaxID=2812733 RepID=A0ABT1WAU0_9PROT|nr:cytochrome c [Acetobacteraceae bacterium KSS8]